MHISDVFQTITKGGGPKKNYFFSSLLLLRGEIFRNLINRLENIANMHCEHDVLDFFKHCPKHRLKIASLRIRKHRIVKTSPTPRCERKIVLVSISMVITLSSLPAPPWCWCEQILTGAAAWHPPPLELLLSNKVRKGHLKFREVHMSKDWSAHQWLCDHRPILKLINATHPAPQWVN